MLLKTIRALLLFLSLTMSSVHTASFPAMAAKALAITIGSHFHEKQESEEYRANLVVYPHEEEAELLGMVRQIWRQERYLGVFPGSRLYEVYGRDAGARRHRSRGPLVLVRRVLWCYQVTRSIDVLDHEEAIGSRVAEIADRLRRGIPLTALPPL